MYSVRAGILMGFVCLFLSGQSLAQKNDSIPEVSHQDGLSRTSMFLIGFGSSIVAGWGFEYSPIISRKLSLDLRGAGSIFPFDRDAQLYHFSLGPHLQVGAKTSRFVVGLNYGLRFENSSVGEYTDAGEYVCCEQKLNNFSHGVIPTIGYRAQTRHGFFFEIDIHMLVFNKTWYRDGSNWSVFPWGEVLFGYRFPSQAKAMEWRMRGGAPVGTNRRQITREFRREVKEEKKLERELIIEDKELERLINARDMPERPRKPAKPVRLDSINRNAGHLNLEVWGLAPWTLNYTYSIPFKRLPRFGIVTRVGAGYTRHLTIPAGAGIEFLSHNNSVSLNIGAALSVADQTKVFYYTGFIGHFNIYKGLSLGIGGYVRYNPAGAEIDYDEWNLLTIAPSGSIGYRFSRRR